MQVAIGLLRNATFAGADVPSEGSFAGLLEALWRARALQGARSSLELERTSPQQGAQR